MSTAERVAARFRKASPPPSPAALAEELKKLVKSLLSIRPQVRDAQEHVNALLKDFMGISGYPGPGDTHVKETRDILYELDHQIGQAFRISEVLADKLEKHKPEPKW